VSGSTVVVLGNTGNLVKNNSVFLGWSTDSSAVVPTFVAGSTFNVLANTTLYAVWGVSGGGGGVFDGGIINGSLEINCKFPYLANASAVFNWMSGALLDPVDYSAFLRFKNVAPGASARSADVYGLLVRNDDPVNSHAAIGVNDSLYVREHLFVGGFVRVAGNVLPLEKWKNNFPTPTVPANKVLDVDLGSEAWPFRDIVTLYGHIGNLTVPESINTDWIQSLSNTDLTITPHAGKKIKLDGDVQITGTLTGGGGNGGTFDGGVINEPIEIKRPPFLQIGGTLEQGIPTLRQWMYDAPSVWSNYLGALTPGLGLRFSETNGHFIDLFPFKYKQDNSPGIAVNLHLIVRKDFAVRGFLKSYEGNIILHGNGPGAVYGNDKWNIGWGPRTGTPFIWLAEGGDPKGDGIIGGNPAAETLLIVTNNTNPQNVPPEIPGTPGQDAGAYKWGHLEAGDIISHRFLKTSHLERAADFGFIALYNDLEPTSSNIHLGSIARPFEGLVVKNLTVLDKLFGNPFDQSLNKADAVTFTNVTVAGTPQAQGNITTNGNIVCHGALDVSHLRRDGGNFIALYSSIEPNGSGINLGSWDRKFNDIFCGGKLYTSHLERAAASGFIALYNSIEPNGSNINLGSSAREFENLYVKNLHVSGSGGGGAGGVQKGTTTQTTNASTGLLTVSFPTAFPAGTIPVVTCTPIDTNGRTISLVIINRTNQNFTVKATLAGTDSHKHKIGDAWGTSTLNWNINSESIHTHSCTNGVTGNAGGHNHGGLTGSENSHTHGVNAASELSDYTFPVTSPAHRHYYARAGGISGNTAGGSVHSHSVSNVGDHGHTHVNFTTNSNSGHSHSFATAKPGFTRSISFRNASGGPVDSGGMLLAGVASQTELHTEAASGGSGIGLPVAVTFCWMAM
jgi:hypothetical protein